MEHSLLIKIEAQDGEISTENYAEIKNHPKDSVEGSRTESPLLQISLNSPDPALLSKLKGEEKEAGNGCRKFRVKEMRILPNEIVGLTGRKWVRPGGKLSYDPSKLLNAKNGNNRQKTRASQTIYEGFYEYDIKVAISKLELSTELIKEVDREFSILRQLDNHENFIRYFCQEKDAASNFVYVATELCICSVKDLYEPKSHHPIGLRETILQKLSAKDVLFQATTGLDYLHRNHFVHRNVKPSSFLIKEILKEKFVVKISDFRLSRPLDPEKGLSGTTASEGWIAPESKNENQPVGSSLDVFILGCFFHYVLTATSPSQKALHPFGRTEFNRESNIQDRSFLVYHSVWHPADIEDEKAVDLIKKMIQWNENARPNLHHVLSHPYFQSSTLKEYYPIHEFKKPGLCVIFNQQIFLNPKYNRPGSEKDCQALDKTFFLLGYEVMIFHNLRAYEIIEQVNQLTWLNFCDYGSLVMCFLSHGDEGTIDGADSIPVNINKLKYQFDFNTCPSLYGKPKIFIVQACQGNLNQTIFGAVSTANPGMQLNNEFQKACVVGNSIKFEELSLEVETPDDIILDSQGPPLLDFITIKGTLPGFISMRNTAIGTYFIQALCTKLADEYLLPEKKNQTDKKDLEELLRGAEGVQSITNRSILNKNNRQTIQWESCLSKFIRF